MTLLIQRGQTSPIPRMADTGNMRRHGLRGFVYRACSILYPIAGIVLATVVASTKADPSRWRLLSEILEWLQQTAWVTTPSLAIVLILTPVIRTMISPPWVWDTVHHLLDRFQEYVFEKESGPLHHHRVTLLKYTRLRLRLCRWPWSGWLVPVERSGHTTRRNRTTFLAPDDADQAEGIAGQTWARNRVVVVNALPEISENPPCDVLAEYTERTFVVVAWWQRHRQHARSFCGIPVEVKGKLWGVIVLDSRNPEGIDENAIRFYSLIGRFLGKLLERA